MEEKNRCWKLDGSDLPTIPLKSIDDLIGLLEETINRIRDSGACRHPTRILGNHFVKLPCHRSVNGERLFSATLCYFPLSLRQRSLVARIVGRLRKEDLYFNPSTR